jgi:hypothetical protein
MPSRNRLRNCGGRISHERVMKTLKLLCLNVMPQFR